MRCYRDILYNFAKNTLMELMTLYDRDEKRNVFVLSSDLVPL